MRGVIRNTSKLPNVISLQSRSFDHYVSATSVVLLLTSLVISRPKFVSQKSLEFSVVENLLLDSTLESLV